MKERRIGTVEELEQTVIRYGFLPLFQNGIRGYSVEDMTDKKDWYSGEEAKDPWIFRELVAERRTVAYGKVFLKRAGFIAKEWYPQFANYRRNGYDFNTRYECGLASGMDKTIYELIAENGPMSSFELKSVICPKSRKGTGFDASLTALQMQTYLTVARFVRKRDKRGKEYGWPAAVYELPETLFGEDYVRSRYHEEPEESKQTLMEHLAACCPEADKKAIERLLR